jgi:ATP-dependent DNA helicase RecG
VPIQLSVYNDKLMLWNEGRLPDDFTIETLLGKHPSRPFNKNVADIFFKAGFIEAWGRGIAKITSGFKNEGLKIPVFETTMGGIMVTIERPGNGKKLQTKNNVTDNVTDIRKNQIIRLIQENNQITMTQLAKKLSVTKMTIVRDIARLKEDNIIERIGSPKGGHWEIIEHD